MHEPEAPAGSVSALTHYFVGDATVVDTLTRVALLTSAAVPKAEFVGLTLIVGRRPTTFAFTHPDAPEIDRAQYQTGDGPCLAAFAENRSVVVPSTLRSPRFRRFCAVAAGHGIMSTLSLPLTTDHGPVGALNIYSCTEDAFTESSIEIAGLFATESAFLLANAQAYWDARTLSENLRAAMDSRADIEQAKGIIMAATGCTPDAAFEQLRDQSQYENVKLRDIATRIVHDAQRMR